MSYDRQIDQTCQHVVLNEALFIDDNRQTIFPARPIASGSQVKLFLNGATEVPRTGVQTKPASTSSKGGPFRIQTGVNDKFQIKVDQSAVLREVVLPPASSLTVDQLVRILNEASLGVVFSNAKGRLHLEGKLSGPSYSFMLPPTCTAASTLGLNTNRESRGKDVYPGWSLISTIRASDQQPIRYVLFDRPLRSSDDFVELSYATIQQECRRCGGLGVENDWRYDARGDVVKARDEALLIQECLKIFYTRLGSNPFHSWYGTNLLDHVGQKIAVASLIQNFITADINQAFARWQSIKRQQESVVGQVLSNAEYPFRLLSVEVRQSVDDVTVFFVSVKVQNRSGQVVLIDRGLSVPEPQDLLGSTAQQGVFRQSLQNYVLTG